MSEASATNRWRRYEVWDERPLRLDRLAAEDPENGFCAANSPFDPPPTLRLAGGRVVELDGRSEAEFDLIDAFIARHHLDVGIAAEAMAAGQRRVRPLAGRHQRSADPVRALRGWHDASQARRRDEPAEHGRADLRPGEAARRAASPRTRPTSPTPRTTRCRWRPTPPTAVALGFAEIETTVRVARNARLNAIGCQVGAAVAGGDTLVQCSVEEAEELRLGLAGLHLLHRDRLGLRHRGHLHRRRRHALVEGVPDRRLCQPRAQGALHLGCGQRAADGHARAQVVPLPRGALPVPAAGDGGAGHPERRHRRRAGGVHRAGRHVGDPGRERVGGSARSGMRVGQRHHPLPLRDPARRQDHALPDGRHRPDLLGHGRDPALRQLVQCLAVQRRGHRGLSRPAARLPGRGRAALCAGGRDGGGAAARGRGDGGRAGGAGAGPGSARRRSCRSSTRTARTTPTPSRWARSAP